MCKIRIKNKTDKCLICDKEFKHFSWDTQKYCSKQCSYIRNKIEVICCSCGKKLYRNKSLFNRNENNYCCKTCYNNRRSESINKIKRNSSFYYNFLNNSNCVSCGEDKTYLLHIHHIDGNNKNNNNLNIEIVCANCHIKRHLKINNRGEYVYHPKSLTDRNIINNL